MAATAPPMPSILSRYAQASASTASVSDSTKYEPASGSTVSVIPDSWATICWVRRAMRAALAVGRPSASSKPLACRLWVPPRAAARLCKVTRTMLFSGCWAVSVDPPVWVWKRSSLLLSSLAPNRSVMIFAHMRRAARNLATSSKKLLWAFQKKLSRLANSSTGRPAAMAAST